MNLNNQPTPTSGDLRLRELERQVRELRMENDFLGKAFFAKKHQ